MFTLIIRYELKDDVRQSMYEYCNEWVESLNGKFKGGNRPNLADLVNTLNIIILLVSWNR